MYTLRLLANPPHTSFDEIFTANAQPHRIFGVILIFLKVFHDAPCFLYLYFVINLIFFFSGVI